MNVRILSLSVFAALPFLLCGQETKLVNCRTLEAAGNFIGSDEVLDNGMVCQTAKASAAEPAKTQPPKPLPGAVISGSEPMSVVEAARAKRKRTATAKDAIAVEPATTPGPTSPEFVPTAEPAATVPKSVAPVEVPPEPATPPPPATKPEMALPSKPPASEVAVVAEPVRNAVPSTLPVSAPEPPPEATKAVTAAAATEPVDAREAEAPVLQEVVGFYDANAGNTVETVVVLAKKPKRNSAGAKHTNASAQATPAAGSAAPGVADATVAVAANSKGGTEPAVKLGLFEQPREVAAGPQTQEQSNLPLDAKDVKEDKPQEAQRPECTKNISLGSLKNEKLVVSTPSWAAMWVGKNQQSVPQVCFSATPMRGAENYLIVFYTAATTAGMAELPNSVLNSPDGIAASEVGAFTTSNGSTWHYVNDREARATGNMPVDADEPSGQARQVLYATAYTEKGVPVAERWPEKAEKQSKAGSKNPKTDTAARETMEQVSEELLAGIVEDLVKL